MNNNVTATNTTSAGVLNTPPTIAPSPPPSVVTTMIDVDSGLTDESFACAFCPSPNTSTTNQYDDAQYVPFPDKTFVKSQDDGQDPLTCGGLAQIYGELKTLEECDSTRAIFNETFDPIIYCQCPNVIETGICFLCLERSTNNVLTPDTPMNGATCGDYADLAKATQTSEFCQSILELEDLQEICCQTETATPTPPDASNNNNEIGGSASLPSIAPAGTTVSSTAASSSGTAPISSRSRLVKAGVIFLFLQGFLMVGFNLPFCS